MKPKLDIYYNASRQARLRITPQRAAICAYLADTDQHPSPYQVFADLKRLHPEISRATVYNTLNTLQQLGAIVELSFGADHTHYDTNPEPHLNLICLRCHQISDYHTNFPLDALTGTVLAETGFLTAAAKIDLVGFCAGCRQKRLAEIRAQYQDEKPQNVTHSDRASYGSV
ncbi:MAG: transcriptional repressor [Anaerolineales bacterium]|nr:transcriptional repressor [Anaerolineales bacterium]